MKYCKRLLSLVLVCVLLCGLFSTQASASSNVLDNTFIRYSLCNKDYAYCFSSNWANATIKNGGVNGGTEGSFLNGRHEKFYHLLEFSNAQNWDTVGIDPIFKKGSSFTIGFYDLLLVASYTGTFAYYPKKVRENIRLEVFSQTGEQKSYYFEPEKGNLQFADAHVNLTDLVATDLPFDVYKFRIVIPSYTADYYVLGVAPSSSDTNSFYNYLGSNSVSDFENIIFYYGIGENYNTVIRVDTEATDTGLLKGIIEWLQKIKDGITNLPQLIWGAIEGGLHGLFIPSTDYFSNYGERWDTLLSQRFGAIYQIGGKLVEFAQTLLSASKISAIDTLDFPLWEFKIGDTIFTFGGWQVPIKIDKFEFLYTACKTAFGIMGTLFFMQGLRKRYDEVMGVEQ